MMKDIRFDLNDLDLLHVLEQAPLEDILKAASEKARASHGAVVSYSRKVFVPLTHLCRDVCAYCTFAAPPVRNQKSFLSPDEVLAIAEAGRATGCHEVLFTLGDKPELRYAKAREELATLGHQTTLSYLEAMCELVFRETGLFPHINAGVMSEDDIARLRKVSISQGLMLETVSDRLCQRGMPHFGSPDKKPSERLATIEAAGKQAVPFTSGILIGIGETRAERIESLLALRALHERYGHIQEVIIQNFRAKPNTRMANAPEPTTEDHLWTIAAARLLLPASMNIQAPPNLCKDNYTELLRGGINDWGGISPVTPDHVNPEAAWPEIDRLADATRRSGLELVERLAIYPAYTNNAERWIDPAFITPIKRASDADGYARADKWSPGIASAKPADPFPSPIGGLRFYAMDGVLNRAESGARLDEHELASLFQARGSGVSEICSAADALRRSINGDTVSYVVTRNINYTNICSFKCSFCAFSKGKTSDNLRGKPYDLALDEVQRRVVEAWDRGATEVCMQGGIHPKYTGQTYLDLVKAVKEAIPEMHVHAFSPLEITHGAQTLGIEIPTFLSMLRDAGLGSLPGTAAEILDDSVRQRLCADKLTTVQWLNVIEQAHRVGLKTTSTIMFGHIDGPQNWARHLLHLRDLQEQTGGITEFVPLPFVHMEAPAFFRGETRKGPTWRETVLIHAVARLALNPLITNIQASWVKLGPDRTRDVLNAGVNDLGGTLMNESISRAAGTEHGQEFAPKQMEALIRSAGRIPRLRTTTYGDAPVERRNAAFAAPELTPMILTPPSRKSLSMAS